MKKFMRAESYEIPTVSYEPYLSSSPFFDHASSFLLVAEAVIDNVRR